jgi:hypothetical protein
MKGAGTAARAQRLREARMANGRQAAHHRPMPRVHFTPQLRRFTSTPEVDSAAATLRAALDDAFAVNPALRSYVLDEQGHVRQHVFVFVDGQRCDDRQALTTPLRPDSRVYVLQALTGG